MNVRNWCPIVFLCALLLIGSMAMSTELTKQPWQAAVDPEGVTVELAPPFDATDAVLLAEDFTDTTFPPTGWTEEIVVDPGTDPDWSRVTSGTYPTISPLSSPAMAKFNSYNTQATGSARLSTPVLDLSMVSLPGLKFWMSHDTGYSSNTDNITVQISTDGGVSWPIDADTFYRYDAACSTPCWQEHAVDLSAFVGEANVMIGFLGVSDYGNNFYFDDVLIAEPAPDLSTSTKSAVAAVLEGDEIAYTVVIANTGDAGASTATMVDPLPVDTTFVVGSVSCTDGSCAYNDVLDQIEWGGLVPVAGSVTVTFSVDTDAVPCGAAVVNSAVIDDPGLIGDPVIVSTETLVVSTFPVLTEGFEDAVFPPAGWGQDALPPNTTDYWTQVTAGSNPTIAPHGGGMMAQWNSYDFPTAGNATRLYTPTLDFTSLGAPYFRFWMSHDSGFPEYDDRVQPQVSTDGGTSWADLGEPISRHDAICGTACWQRHSLDLAAYAGLPSVTLGLVATTEYGNNFFIDDVSVGDPWYPCPHVVLESDYVASGCNGEILRYPLSVENNFTSTDTLEISKAATWPTSVDPSAFALAPGEGDDSELLVAIEYSIPGGEFDTAALTVTGLTSGLTDTANITTYTYVAADYQDYANVPDTPTDLRSRDHGLVYYDGKLYKFGGYNGSTLASTGVYDIATDTWSTADDMPSGRYYFDCVGIGAKMYCGGGYNSGGQTTMYIFDPAAAAGSQWTTGASMPVYRYAYAGVALNGKYYLLGGYSGGAYSASCDVYDPASDTWDTIPDMETPRRYGLAGAIGGKIYITGGLSASGTVTDSTQMYDPATNTWYPRAPHPGGGWVRTADGVMDDRFLVIVGGYAADATASNYVLAYDALNDAWLPLQMSQLHLTYGAEGDIDDDGNLWVASGRLYEGGSWSYGPYTMKVSSCSRPTVDLSVVKDDGVTQVAPGDMVTYTITVTNAGPSGVLGAKVIDNFPSDLLNVTWTCTPSGSGACTAAGTGTIDDKVNIPAGEAVVYTAIGEMAVDAVGVLFEGRPSLVNTANVFPPAGVPDVDLANNSSTDIDEIGTVADLAIVKDNGATEVTAGMPVTYIITVINNGPNDEPNATVIDSFPADITGVTWICAGSSGGTCTPSGAGNVMDVASLPVGGSVVYTATGTVSPDATGTVDNTATVSGSSASDPDPANNTSTDSDTVVAEVDLAITKTDMSCYVLPGGSTTYTITVTNPGPSSGIGAAVVDSFPVEFTSVNWTCAASGGATCTASGSGDINDTVDVPPGGTLVYSAVATVDAGAVGSVSNTATVEPAMGVTDTDLTNNESTDTDALELPVFCDGFESGNTDAWSSVQP